MSSIIGIRRTRLVAGLLPPPRAQGMGRETRIFCPTATKPVASSPCATNDVPTPTFRDAPRAGSVDVFGWMRAWNLVSVRRPIWVKYGTSASMAPCGKVLSGLSGRVASLPGRNPPPRNQNSTHRLRS